MFYIYFTKKFLTFDQSIASTKSKYIKLNTKTQNIFCHLNENLTTFLYTLTGGTRKQKEKKVFFLKVYTKVKCYFKNWVLVFSFMYLVSVDPMDKSIICGHPNSPVKSVFFCQAQTSLKIVLWILDCFARLISKFPPNLVFCLFLQPAESVRNQGYKNRYNLMDCGHKSRVNY